MKGCGNCFWVFPGGKSEGCLKGVELGLHLGEVSLSAFDLLVQRLKLGELLAKGAGRRGFRRRGRTTALLAGGLRSAGLLQPAGNGDRGDLEFFGGGGLTSTALLAVHLVYEGDDLCLLLVGVSSPTAGGLLGLAAHDSGVSVTKN